MISFQCILTEVDEKRNYLIEQIKQNDLTSQKHKNTCKYLD